MRAVITFCVLPFLLSLLAAFPCHAESGGTTTIIFVRHAEENRLSDDISLTDEGSRRAKELARVLRDVKIDVVFATPTVRAETTAGPTAEEKGLQIKTYNYGKYPDLVPFMNSLLRNHRGQTILIAGHSDDVPVMLSILRKEFVPQRDVAPIPKPIYDNLFVAFVPVNGKADVVQLKYGELCPPK